MKPSAIVYTSNTGFTAMYARLLGEATGLPVHALEDAKGQLAPSSSIIYLGWLMAGKVQGYKKAAGQFDIRAVCGVGMGGTGSQMQDVRKANPIPDSTPVFTMQGGFDISKLKGIYKFMMTIMAKTAGRGLADKKDRTPQEDMMLDLLQHGGNHVSPENLNAVLEWYRTN